MRTGVWVETNADGQIIRIFKNRHSTEFQTALMEDRALLVARKVAIDEIRKEVFRLADGKCKYCGRAASDLHEEKLRSLGGEFSIWNSVSACRDCHKKIGHADRRLHFGEHNGE